MEAFDTHTGIGVPLRRSNVDTDQIIPAVFLKRVTRTGFEDGLFATWRSDPAFVLNLSPFDRGSVLVAGPDFGTGSSREHAVWALMDYGFEAIIAPSFGDIFVNNSSKQGLVIVELTVADVDELMALINADPTRLVVVDVDQQRVEVPEAGFQRHFEIDPMTRERLLNGWDDISLTLLREPAIAAFESTEEAPSLIGIFDDVGHVR
jgi:3-isopropylmalate/(R)-2-methylmalate dehydratase small subunit